jgi:hypothetical protein
MVVTIHGDIVVAKFFDPKGPNGTYSLWKEIKKEINIKASILKDSSKKRRREKWLELEICVRTIFEYLLQTNHSSKRIQRFCFAPQK